MVIKAINSKTLMQKIFLALIIASFTASHVMPAAAAAPGGDEQGQSGRGRKRKGSDENPRRSGRLKGDSADGCPVCLQPFDLSMALETLPCCKKIFCVTCLDRWFTVTGTCPLCREALAECLNCKKISCASARVCSHCPILPPMPNPILPALEFAAAESFATGEQHRLEEALTQLGQDPALAPLIRNFVQRYMRGGMFKLPAQQTLFTPVEPTRALRNLVEKFVKAGFRNNPHYILVCLSLIYNGQATEALRVAKCLEKRISRETTLVDLKVIAALAIAHGANQNAPLFSNAPISCIVTIGSNSMALHCTITLKPCYIELKIEHDRIDFFFGYMPIRMEARLIQ